VSVSTGEVSDGLAARLELDRSIVVHVRRGPSFAVLARFLTRLVADGAPPEVALLRERLRGDSVPVLVDGAPLAREATEPHVVCSAIVDDGPLAVRLELLARADRAPTLELRELGVVVGHADWPASWLTERTEAGHVPLRVIVSSEQLPTNVSRSKLRDDALDAVVRIARRGLSQLIAAVRARLADPTAARGLEEAIAPLAVGYMRALSEGTASREPGAEHLTELLDLPLLASATGAPRPLRALSADRRAVARTAKRPLSEAFAAVSADVFWRRPDRAIDVLVETLPRLSSDDVLEAGAARAAHAAQLPDQPFGLAAEIGGLVRGRVNHADGFSAEISVRGGSDARPIVHAWLGGRPFVEIGERMRTLPLDAAVSWPGRIESDMSYERLSCEETTLNLVEGKLQYAAFDLVADAGTDLVRDHAATLRAWSAMNPRIWRVHKVGLLPIWPVLGGAPLSTAEVVKRVERRGWFRWLRPNASDVVVPKDGLVLVLEAADVAALRAHLPARVVARDYARWSTSSPSNPERVRRLLAGGSSTAPIVESKDQWRVLSRVSSMPVVIHVHRGEVITRVPTTGGVSHAIESEELEPIVGAKIEVPPEVLESAAVEAIDAALRAIERGELDLATSPDVLEALARGGVRHVRALRSNARFKSLALFELIEAPSSDSPTSQWVSGAMLAERFPDGVPWAKERAAWPEAFVRVDEDAVTLLARLSGRALRSLAEEPPVDQSKKAETLRVLALLERPLLDPRARPTGAKIPAKPSISPANERPEPTGPRSITEALRDLFTPSDGLFLDPRATLALAVLEGLGLASARALIVDRESVGDGRGEPMLHDRAKGLLTIAERHPVLQALIARGDASSVVAAAIVAIGSREEASVIASLIDALT